MPNLKTNITAALLAIASIGAFAQSAETPRVDRRKS